MNEYTVAEVAQEMDVHEQTVEEWVDEGKLVFFRFGKDRIFTDGAVNALKMAVRSELPSLEELAESFDVNKSVMYYAFRVKRSLQSDAMNGNNYCYGENKIREVMNGEGWLHTKYGEEDNGVHVVVNRDVYASYYVIQGNEVNFVMASMGGMRRAARPTILYTKRQMAARLGISVRTIERWIHKGKIKPSGKLPSGESVWNWSDADDIVDELMADGWTMSDASFIFDLSYGLVNYILNNKYRLVSIGIRNRAKVYDPNDVKVAMERSGKMAQEIRIMRIDGSIKPDQRGWFVVRVDDETNSLKILTDELITLGDAEDVADKNRSKAE